MSRKISLMLFCGLALTACGKPDAPPIVQEPGQDQSQAEDENQRVIPYREPDFLGVTAAYGPLVIREGRYDAESPRKPWSAWWLPRNSKYLFEGSNGNPSPLEKYDQYARKKHNRATEAAKYEKKELYDEYAIVWEGACHAWATASLIEKEPIQPVEREGIKFSVGDQKALLVKSYENTKGKVEYGQRFNGTRGNRYEDIFPDQFHRFVQVEMFEKKKPFILDKDAGIAVWNTPVWSASFTIQKSSADPNRMHVRAELMGADPWVQPDFVGTRPILLTYYYDLIGFEGANGEFFVDYGEWKSVGGVDSTLMHPDYVIAVPDAAEHMSRNSHLHNELIKEIIGN